MAVERRAVKRLGLPLYVILAALPTLFWLGLHSGNSQGWGQWATAGIYMYLVGFSLLVGLLGLGLVVRQKAQGEPVKGLVLATCLGLLPVFYLLARILT